MSKTWTTSTVTKREGATLIRVHWRDPKTGAHRSRATKTGDPRIAAMRRREIEHEVFGAGRASSTVAGSADRLLEAYLRHVTLTKSPDTAKCYSGPLRQVVAAWRAISPDRWCLPMWESLVATKREQRAQPTSRVGWSARSVSIATAASRDWIAWAAERGLPLADYVGKWRAPQTSKRKVSGAPLEHVLRLLAGLRGTPYEVPAALASCAGLRKGEIIRARREDWDKAAGVLLVRSGKRRPERRVGVPPILAEILDRRAPAEGPFVPVPGTLAAYRRLCAHCLRVGIAPLTWHQLRHAYATVMLKEGGAELHEVQAALGHASLATTGVYLDSHLSEIQAAANRAFVVVKPQPVVGESREKSLPHKA